MPKSNYKKQNFKNGNVLMAEQLNLMEDALASKIDKVQGAEHAGKTFVVDETGNVQLTEMPKAEQNNEIWRPSVDEDGNISWKKSAESTAPATQNIKGKPGGKGDPGEPGFSPSASVTQTADGAVLTVTDKNGTTTATIKNGSSEGGGSGESLVPITTDEIDDICSDGTKEPVLIENDDDAVEISTPEEESV